MLGGVSRLVLGRVRRLPFIICPFPPQHVLEIILSRPTSFLTPFRSHAGVTFSKGFLSLLAYFSEVFITPLGKKRQATSLSCFAYCYLSHYLNPVFWIKKRALRSAPHGIPSYKPLLRHQPNCFIKINRAEGLFFTDYLWSTGFGNIIAWLTPTNSFINVLLELYTSIPFCQADYHHQLSYHHLMAGGLKPSARLAFRLDPLTKTKSVLL